MANYKLKLQKSTHRKIQQLALFIILLIFINPILNAQSFGEGITAKKFYSSTVDDNNVVWFLTETGIVSFDGEKWSVHNNNSNIEGKEIKDLEYDLTENGNGLWIASSDGAMLVQSPINTNSETKSFSPDNSEIVGKDVLGVTVSKKGMRWFATDKGISAYKDDKWFENKYMDLYPDDIFQYFPYSTLATSNNGDTLYVGTLGGGVMRYYKDDVDAISGASEYAVWGPILIPSDSIFSVYISPDGTQWMGTDMGVGKHSGFNTLEGWKILDTTTGLAHDKVQAINSDSKGKMYFGTKGGLSILDGENWTTLKVEDGLVSNNILTIAIDNNDVVWLGTDNGVSCLKDGEITSYK